MNVEINLVEQVLAPSLDVRSVETPAAEPVIRMREVSKIYHTAGQSFVALDRVDLDIYPGEFVSVVGRSGSGKSTLVNMLTGIDRPTSGRVWVMGTEIHKLDESEMSRWRGHNLGIVFQFYQLLPMLSLLENVLLPMDFCGCFPPEEREARAHQLLSLVGVSHLAHKLPAEVAGGQQQAAAIARALANDPPVLVADEPTGNLDSVSAAAIFDLFVELAAQGKTIVMVTHDPELAQRTTRQVVLADGRIVAA